MAARSWFYASEGQQHGPYPEIQLRELIARGTITADTLVWTEGMANWQRAGDIPGLAPGASGPPAMPRPGASTDQRRRPRRRPAVDRLAAVGTSSARAVLFVIGFLLVIPAPWVAVWFYRWVVVRAFTCRDGPISASPARSAISGTCSSRWCSLGYAGANDLLLHRILVIPVQASLSWMLLRWIAANLSFERPAAADRLQRQRRSAYRRLAIPAGRLRHHHHRLGLGDHGLDALDLPQYRGHATRGRFQRPPDWRCCGEPSCSRSAAASSFRFRG